MSYPQRKQHVSGSRSKSLIDLIVFAASFLPLMVTRLLLSLRKASHPETLAEWNIDHFTGFYATTAITITMDQSALSDTQKSIRPVSETDVVDFVSDLPDFENRGKGHPGALDGEV